MLARIAQRYAIAVVAFLIAVVWTGIGLTSAVECLAVFSVVYVVAAAVQARRTATAPRPRPRRRAPVRYEDEDSAVWPQLDFPSTI
jgi:hypothetical protein